MSIYNNLIKLKNASNSKKEVVVLSHSKYLESILSILKKNEFILDFKKSSEKDVKKQVFVTLNPNKSISEFSFISTPGHRIYLAAKDMPVIKSGRGIAIVSTNKGVMVGYKAHALKLGGEVICKVA